jgi:light-independent protochlorophyllide reductase subunit B
MKLAYWMYAGPAHIGTLRVASSFKNVHAIMHAPLGDDYFNVMRSMLERERDFTPVTASIVDRHVLARGSQEKVVENITRKNKEESPDLVLLTPTCTSSILQEDLHNFVERSTIALSPSLNHIQPSPDSSNVSSSEFGNSVNSEQKAAPSADVILADVNHYRVNELQAADRTLEQIVRFYIEKAKKQQNLNTQKTAQPSVNIIGIFTLGFHNQHDCRELKRLFNDLGITINEIIPEGGCVHNLKNLPKAWFNFIPYREIGLMTAVYLKSEFNMPYVSTTPMGLVDTSLCIREIAQILENLSGLTPTAHNGLITNNSHENISSTLLSTQSPPLLYTVGKHHNLETLSQKANSVSHNNENRSTDVPPILQGVLPKYIKYIDEQTRFVSQAAWFSRSIDCQNLTGKKAVVFGDATHAAAMTKILSREMGIRVTCAGTYCKHDADWFREQVTGFCDQILITDDHTQVGDMIALLEPSAIFGTQMERHVGKRLDIPCGVISAPVHIQNFPLGYRPFLGYEGANQIADLVYNSFSLGMEEHLLQIFGGHDNVSSHQQNTIQNNPTSKDGQVTLTNLQQEKGTNISDTIQWSTDGLAELSKVPGFVRGKVKRNTEKYAEQNQLKLITAEIMYAAKEALTT